MEWSGVQSAVEDALRRGGRLVRRVQAFCRSAGFRAGSALLWRLRNSGPARNIERWLTAVDSTTGKVRWKKQWPTPLIAGVTATAGGVLFTGDLDNNFLVLDASNGKTLYSFNTGGSIGGGVITYEVGSKQYVATTSGVVSGFFGGSGTSAIIVFALP